jgi:hypothetical protein
MCIRIGTYTTLSQQAKCTQCPAGYYCSGGVIDYTATQYACLKGYYCLNGTTSATQYPCPEGTYNDRTGRRSQSECTVVGPGSFSNGTGNTAPTGLCGIGFYCTNGSITSSPTYSNALGSSCVNGTQAYCANGPCVMGQECPVGTIHPLPCRGGSYCSDNSGKVIGVCQAGYYCIEGLSTPIPIKVFNGINLVGDVCPRGTWCGSNTTYPNLCPPGTFSNFTKNEKLSQCQQCPGGFICPNFQTTAPTACNASFICPPGSTYAFERCPIGHYCPNSQSIVPCAAGIFVLMDTYIQIYQCMYIYMHT